MQVTPTNLDETTHNSKSVGACFQGKRGAWRTPLPLIG